MRVLRDMVTTDIGGNSTFVVTVTDNGTSGTPTKSAPTLQLDWLPRIRATVLGSGNVIVRMK